MSGPVEIEVVEHVRRDGIAAGAIRRFVARVASAKPPRSASSVTIALVGDARMRRLNLRHRGKNRTTDVLSFDGGASPDGRAHLGDIVISVPQAARQAREAGHALSQELRVLIVHGWLHLLGYDHERDDGRMHREQDRLLRTLAGRA